MVIARNPQMAVHTTVINHRPTGINTHPMTTRSGFRAIVTPKPVSTCIHPKTTYTRLTAITRNPEIGIHSRVINHSPTGINKHTHTPHDHARRPHGYHSPPANRRPPNCDQPQHDGEQHRLNDRAHRPHDPKTPKPRNPWILRSWK